MNAKPKDRKKNILINLGLSLFSVVIVLAILEGFARLAFGSEIKSTKEFRLSQPAPYQHSEYFSEEFIEEAFRQPGKWINPEGTRLIYPDNFKGRYFIVEDNIRRTTDQPDSSEYTIYLFGGSTAYCSEVPDTFTLASYLQRGVNQRFGETYAVVNLGVTSVNSFQQLKRLEETEIDSGDVVIFYGGVNDALLFTTGRVDGWIVGENYVEYSKKLNAVQKARFKIYKSLHDHSKFVDKFLDPYNYQTPVHLEDPERLASLRKELAESNLKIIQQADSIARSNGAIFINYLQPWIKSREPNSNYELRLLSNTYLIPQPHVKALENAYPILVENISVLNQAGVLSYDLTGVFDAQKDEFFLDYCHITEKGNAHISNSILKGIEPKPIMLDK